MSRAPLLTGRLILGIIVVIIGALWTLESFGVVRDAGDYLRWWPVLLLAFGVVRLVGIDGHRHVTVGVVALIVGAWLLANELDFIRFSVFKLWPVALVIVGLAMVSRAVGRKPLLGRVMGNTADDLERVNTFAFWSGIERKPTSQQYLGGEVTAIMGGAEIDLRSAGTPPGGATMDLFVWMGGVEIFVPKHWRVINEATAIMGAVEDQREAPSHETSDTVRLRGLVIWGGIEIKD